MIKHFVTGKVHESNGREAMQIMRKFLEQSRTRFPELEVEAYWQRFDSPLMTFHWVTIYKDLGEYDRLTKEMMGLEPDEEMQELWGRWAEIMVQGSEGWMMLESL